MVDNSLTAKQIDTWCYKTPTSDFFGGPRENLWRIVPKKKKSNFQLISVIDCFAKRLQVYNIFSSINVMVMHISIRILPSPFVQGLFCNCCWN